MKGRKPCGKKFFAAVLALVMVFSMSIGTAIPSQAEENDVAVSDGSGAGDDDTDTMDSDSTEGNENNDTIVDGDSTEKQEDAAVSGMITMASPAAVEPVALNETAEDGLSGTCGENLTWRLVKHKYASDKYTLFIEGSGDMEDFEAINTSTTTVPWDAYKLKIEAVCLPDGLTSIGSWAFYRCLYLTEVVIPDSVTRIGDCAFRSCIELTDIVIPGSVKAWGEEQGNQFMGCSALEKVKISEGVEQIPKSAFNNCKNLKMIEIPRTVESIGMSAFMRCTSLGVAPDGKICYGGTEEQWTALVDAIEPGSKTDKTQEILRAATMNYGEELQESTYTISVWDTNGGTLTASKYEAKPGEKITLSAVPDSGYNFIRCGGYNSDYPFLFGDRVTGYYFTMPARDVTVFAHFCQDSGESGATTWRVVPNDELGQTYTLVIEGSRMYDEVYDDMQPWYDYREDITAVSLSDGLTHIGQYAFTGLTKLNDIEIPDSVTSMGHKAFAHTALLDVTIPANAVNYSAGDTNSKYYNNNFFGCSLLQKAEFLDGAIRIPTAIFNECQGLKEVVIPASVKEIQEYAFEGCTALETVYFRGTEEEWNELLRTKGTQVKAKGGAAAQTGDTAQIGVLCMMLLAAGAVLLLVVRRRTTR